MVRDKELFKRGVQNGQLPLFEKPTQPKLNTPDDLRRYLRQRGVAFDPRILTEAAKNHIRRELEHETSPRRAAILRALLQG